MNNFINFQDFTPDYLESVVDLALEIKHNPAKYAKALQGKNMYMLFQKTSTRTALSFAFGMNALGGHYLIQNWEDSNFAVGEIQDEVLYVSSQVDFIMARLKTNADLNVLAKYSSVPVINGCCNMYHPSQIIADLVTIKEIFGTLKVQMMYIGISNNVLNSLMEALPLLGGELYSATPVINEPSINKELYEKALKTGHFHDIGNRNPTIGEVQNIIRDVDIVYTDTWLDMEFVNDSSFAGLKKERTQKMLPFQVNAELLRDSKAIVLHDMPIHVGYEISRETVESNIKTILQQASNRTCAAQSILMSLVK